MNILKSSLLANASFSILTGLTLLLLNGKMIALFGLSSGTVFFILGAGLLLFAATVGIEAQKMRPAKVKFIIVQDALWVIASLAILLTKPFAITSTGYTLIGVVAFIVLLFGIGQSYGLKQMQAK